MAGKKNLTADSYFTFRDGNKMPLLGLGTWQAMKDENMEPAVYAALEAGYRHIDTAFIYYNEKAVGNAIKKWIADGKGKREDIFVTTKLPAPAIRPHDVPIFLKKSLDNLGLDYVDLYLIHMPIGLQMPANNMDGPFNWMEAKVDMTTDLVGTWKAMEVEVDEGRAKSIGISNFNIKQVERIVNAARIIPACNQVECHVNFQQKPLKAVLDKHGIALVAYAALGSPGRKGTIIDNGKMPELLSDPIVVNIAKKHNKSPSHVLVRFLLQEGMSVIPKSKNPERIKDNINLYDFSLDIGDMFSLRALDQGEAGRSFKMDFIPGFEKHPEFPTSDYM